MGIHFKPHLLALGCSMLRLGVPRYLRKLVLSRVNTLLFEQEMTSLRQEMLSRVPLSNKGTASIQRVPCFATPFGPIYPRANLSHISYRQVYGDHFDAFCHPTRLARVCCEKTLRDILEYTYWLNVEVREKGELPSYMTVKTIVYDAANRLIFGGAVFMDNLHAE